VTKKEHIVKIWTQFNYNFFPVAYHTKLEFKSDDFDVIECIGAGNEEISKHYEEETDWKTSNHCLNDILFKEKINFLLLFFNRVRKHLPKAVLANVCDFLRYDKKTIANVKTLMPSFAKFEKNGNQVEGGLILLKLKLKTELESKIVKRGSISVNCITHENKPFSQSFHFIIDLSNIPKVKKECFFSNTLLKRD